VQDAGGEHVHFVVVSCTFLSVLLSLLMTLCHDFDDAVTHNVHVAAAFRVSVTAMPTAVCASAVLFQVGYFQFTCISVIVTSWNSAKLRDTSRLDVVRAVAH